MTTKYMKIKQIDGTSLFIDLYKINNISEDSAELRLYDFVNNEYINTDKPHRFITSFTAPCARHGASLVLSGLPLHRPPLEAFASLRRTTISDRFTRVHQKQRSLHVAHKEAAIAAFGLRRRTSRVRHSPRVDRTYSATTAEC